MKTLWVYIFLSFFLGGLSHATDVNQGSPEYTGEEFYVHLVATCIAKIEKYSTSAEALIFKRKGEDSIDATIIACDKVVVEKISSDDTKQLISNICSKYSKQLGFKCKVIASGAATAALTAYIASQRARNSRLLLRDSIKDSFIKYGFTRSSSIRAGNRAVWVLRRPALNKVSGIASLIFLPAAGIAHLFEGSETKPPQEFDKLKDLEHDLGQAIVERLYVCDVDAC